MRYRMKQTLRPVLVSVVLVGIAFLLLRIVCPASGIGLTSSRRSVHRLKNRVDVPKPTDFDERVTLEALLQPGHDQSRWPGGRAARLEGYVVRVWYGPFEAANCYCSRDIHIVIGPSPEAANTKHVVLEITPRVGPSTTAGTTSGSDVRDWSLPSLANSLVGHRVQFEGWLFFDAHHAGEAENTTPGRAENWRATAWEIHPVTRISMQ